MSEEIRGFKVFAPDWTRGDKQYSCPGTFKAIYDPTIGEYGITFHKEAVSCFGEVREGCHLAEVIARGTIHEEADTDWFSATELEILREISSDEFAEMTDSASVNRNVFISGSFRNITREERGNIEEIVGCLTKELFQRGFSIYSGNGRGLGEIVVAQVDKHNREGGSKGKLVNLPLIFTGDDEEVKAKKNQHMMENCNIMIIICGQNDGGVSKNVVKQFKQFLQDREDCHPVIIPIPNTGYAAKEIFNSEEYENCAFFKENKEKLECLFDGTSEEIAKDVVKLIVETK